MRNEEPSRRTVLLRMLAVTGIVTSVIHFAVAGEHFQDYWAFGVFMLVAAWLQLAWAGAVLLRPSRTLLVLGAVLNAGVVATYVVTRTVGDVIGPSPNDVEPLGFGDTFCTVCEALVVAGVLLLLLRPLQQSVTRRGAAGAVAATGAVAAALLSISLVAGGSEMVMSGDTGSASAATAVQAMPGMPGMAGTSGGAVPAVSVATDSPAGPVTMPDADMQMEAGMQMVGGPCTSAPTAAQQAATARLVNATWADNQRYESLAAARAAGFTPITPTGLRVVHYVNIANYVATAEGGPILDPTAPQSLVYANTPGGAVLVAVMYIETSRTDTPPDPGGCLTQWHMHTNLCSTPGGAVVAVTPPACPAGSVNQPSTPMLHVWFAPIPGGPTAVDASDAAIVRAAERLHPPAPPNGTA